jgi:hypothetical protein
MENQLDEKITFKQLMTASLMGYAAMASSSINRTPEAIKPVQLEQPEEVKPADDGLVDLITDKYRVDPLLASQIVDLAKKHGESTFPTAKDILTVIGIESSFNPLAKSKLKHDPARGLMQVRSGVWKLPAAELTKVENQIKHGAQILKHYRDKLKSTEAAIKAYNIGITKYLHDKNDARAKAYLAKFNRERTRYGA